MPWRPPAAPARARACYRRYRPPRVRLARRHWPSPRYDRKRNNKERELSSWWSPVGDVLDFEVVIAVRLSPTGSGMTRQSIVLARLFRGRMDARVKPGHDDCCVPRGRLRRVDQHEF